MGYQRWRFVRTKIPEELICTICEGVLCNPIMCRLCGGYYCESCLADREKIQEDPETCDHPVESQTAVNKFLREKIDNELIVCSFKCFGCDYVGRVLDIDAHEQNCPFTA